MTLGKLTIKGFSFLGQGKPCASLEFNSGVNVICGASDTGKSFITEALDFLTGGTTELRDIPERVGYDRSRIGIETDSGIFTVERSVSGGNFRLFEGLSLENIIESEGVVLKAKHDRDREDNLSSWLLKNIGLLGKRLRKNAQGATQSLSFRDLARLTIVQEEEVIKRSSPFLTGQHISKTSEWSALKLLLTGVDDSAIQPETGSDQESAAAEAKIELIEQWIADLRAEIDDDSGKSELDAQLVRLEQTIEIQRQKMQQTQDKLESAITIRRDILSERESVNCRINEISDLISRFTLLSQHYEIDLERLTAIEESGSLFVHQEAVACPLCGASVTEQHNDETCDGAVELVVESAKAEKEKIHKLASELELTKRDLLAEASYLKGQLSEVDGRYLQVDAEIREAISPDLGTLRSFFSELLEKKGEVKKAVDILSRIERLETKKLGLIKSEEQADQEPIRTDISKSVLSELSLRLENILNAWRFPGSNRTYFDESARDFVIDGKPRGSRGKGLRAITHAAVTIALLEYCESKNLPHPGFVVLDSPLLAYWKPEGVDDNLQGMDLKDRFYDYLVSHHSDKQIIIIENERPSAECIDKLSMTVFTKNPQQGRYGLFPPVEPISDNLS